MGVLDNFMGTGQRNLSINAYGLQAHFLLALINNSINLYPLQYSKNQITLCQKKRKILALTGHVETS